MNKKFILIAVFFLYGFVSCKHAEENKNIPLTDLQHQCMHRLTTVIVYDIFSPPVASRIYAYSTLAWYEAIRFSNASGNSITAKLKQFEAMPQPEAGKSYNYTIAAVKSFFTVAKALTFSKDSLSVTESAILQSLKNTIPGEVYTNSITLGEAVATVILKRAAADNYKKTRGMPRYSVFKEPGMWQQTPPDYADAAEPHWRLIVPMLMDSAAQFQPPPPPAYSLEKNSIYYKELKDVFEVSKKITPQQDTIARYWDDNPFVTQHEGHLTYATKKTTPGGHWMGIISILCRQTGKDAVSTAKIYALTSCAMFDGFISCWDEKYRSRMVRPVTVIRENIESEWSPLLQTPPFPEYTSGHSVITSAAAAVLTRLIGDSVSFTDTTEMEYLGMNRSFKTIQSAADEACISRLYGGIHYLSAIEEGKKQGNKVGQLYLSIFK